VSDLRTKTTEITIKKFGALFFEELSHCAVGYDWLLP